MLFLSIYAATFMTIAIAIAITITTLIDLIYNNILLIYSDNV
jgi:hypothetical protein